MAKCPKCSVQLDLAGVHAGQSQCPHCGAVFNVRRKSPPVTPVAVPVSSPPTQSTTDEPWLIDRDGERFGPYTLQELSEYALQNRIFRTDLAWRRGMPNWLRLDAALPGLTFPPAAPIAPPLPAANHPQANKRDFVAKRIPAAVCAFFLGALGIHKFVLGQNNAGIIMLACWFGCMSIGMILILPLLGVIVLGVIAFIEAIIYITMNDEQFYRAYAIEKRQWF